MRASLAIITLLALAIARAADLLTTFYFSPGMEREGNPILNLFPNRAVGLVGISIVEFALCCAGLLLFWRGPSIKVTTRSPRTFARFVAAWIRQVVGRRDPLSAWFPGGLRWKDGLQAIRMMVMALSWAIVLGSAASARAWFAVWGDPNGGKDSVFATVSFHGATAIPYLASVVGWLIGAALFFWSEYLSTSCQEAHLVRD